MARKKGLYILMISPHGLIRSKDLELGRDSDTGGQTLYVVDLARKLAARDDIDRVDLVTRQIHDPRVDPIYSEPVEEIVPKGQIIRLPFGPRRYLHKETLWQFLDSFVDQMIKHIRQVGRTPDIIHGHYADAGEVGAILAEVLGVPLVFTGHSLGRQKRRRLMNSKMTPDNIEKKYSMSRRIEAEEFTLDVAQMVVASTMQEASEQYAAYDNFNPDKMVVIPPGVDLDKLYPKKMILKDSLFFQEISRFLANPYKPIVLALSRADSRKNIPTLIRAYAEDEALQKRANLVLVMGPRADYEAMPTEAKHVIREVIHAVDKYDLYGKVAYPKSQIVSDVAEVYHVATALKGVFINPALTEPFGLTLLEAAACGLPVVATNHGGPNDILKVCENGILVDPLNTGEMANALKSILGDKEAWTRLARNGIQGTRKYYSWRSHAEHYVKECRTLLKKTTEGTHHIRKKSLLPIVQKAIVSDIDNTLIGDRDATKKLVRLLKKHTGELAFVVASGRCLESTLDVLKEWDVPIPDVLITSVGSEIYYGSNLFPDKSWEKHIDSRWHPEQIRRLMKKIKEVELQVPENQQRFKVSYNVTQPERFSGKTIKAYLRRHAMHVNVIYSHNRFLDILPIRASKRMALRYFAMKWGLPFENILVAGDSGNDREMLRGDVLGVVVANYSSELESLKNHDNIYFAAKKYALGILEGIDHYQFLAH